MAGMRIRCVQVLMEVDEVGAPAALPKVILAGTRVVGGRKWAVSGSQGSNLEMTVTLTASVLLSVFDFALLGGARCTTALVRALLLGRGVVLFLHLTRRIFLGTAFGLLLSRCVLFGRPTLLLAWRIGLGGVV
jgi:hypothetical protein